MRIMRFVAASRVFVQLLSSCLSKFMANENLIYKALANPFRREILKWLKTPNEFFVQGCIDLGCGVPSNAIHARSGLSQSTASAHVAALIEAGLLVSTRVGQWMFLSRNEAVIRAFAAEIRLHL
jgi:DNA-binding transcriptional ArsR family regulator